MALEEIYDAGTLALHGNFVFFKSETEGFFIWGESGERMGWVYWGIVCALFFLTPKRCSGRIDPGSLLPNPEEVPGRAWV